VYMHLCHLCYHCTLTDDIEVYMHLCHLRYHCTVS
jgi:hypothetical protein